MTGLTPEHAAYLAAHAVDLELAASLGVASVASVKDLPDEWRRGLGRRVPGIVFPWTSYDGRVSPQLRPDTPFLDENGEEQKYAFQKGAPSVLWAVRVVPDSKKIIFSEGSKQTLVAAKYAPPEYSVYGVAGCWGWSHEKKPIRDLRVARGCDVVVIYDADTATKIDVYNAGVRLTAALEMKGAASVRWARLPAGRNVGLDDVLAESDTDEDRVNDLQNLIAKAKVKIVDVKPKAKPKVKKRTGPAAKCFDADGNFLAATAAQAVLDHSPAALTAEGQIAVYADGVYKIDKQALTGAVVWLLDEEYRRTYVPTIEDVAVTALREAGAYLPERSELPLVNLRNGMLDLRTGELLAHDPKYLSGVQLPIDYDTAATCPHYDRWIKEVCPDQGEDLDEVCSQMIDPTRCPSKAVFHYGPSRSGKSTHLRLLEALAGPGHRSAVTLHQLFADRFAAANIYGSILNAAADLSSAHVEDLSVFKTLTGADSVHANRKYGGQFAFRNRALFAFSANELPTVSEQSRAYSERIKPFRFDQSFAGHENQAIEDRMMGELPGIFNRLVAGWKRRYERGGFLDTAPAVRADFEAKSDRVRLWLHERGLITTLPDGTAPAPGQLLPVGRVTTPRALARMFNDWALEQGGSKMGERKIIERLTSITGVERVQDSNRVKGLNIRAWAVGAEIPDEAEAKRAETAHSAPRVAPVPAAQATGNAETGAMAAPAAGSGPATSAEVVPAAETAAISGQDQPSSAVVSPSAESSAMESATGTETDLRTAPLPGCTGAPSGESVVFDLETCSAAELHSGRTDFVRLAGYQVGDRDVVLTTDFDGLAAHLRDVGRVIGHNVMGFDLPALARYHGLDFQALVRRDAVFDTLLAARYLDPPMAREKGVDFARRYDLDSVVKKYVDPESGKSHNLKALAKKHGGFDQIPVDDEEYCTYLRRDVEINHRLAAVLTDLIGIDDHYLRREHRVAAIAAQISLNGFLVDTELLGTRLRDGEGRMRAALRQLHERFGIPLHDEKGEPYTAPLATKAGKLALIAALRERGVTDYWITGKSSDIATSAEAMRALGRQYVESKPEVADLCRLVIAVVTTRAVYHTIENSMMNGRVHPSVGMNQSTGRWSLTRPGLTVLGKRGGRYREREVLRADPGHVVIACDLSQVDMRAIAGLSGDRGYIELLRSGDPHSEIAKALFGTAEQREEAKKIGHGWNYGRGITGICETYDLPRELVKTFDTSMRERFPRLVEWQDEVRAQAASGDLLDNGWGRRMRADPLRAHTQGPALKGQGCARDIMMEGLLRLPPEVLPYLRAQVHDEIVLSVPAADAADIQRVVINALSFDWHSPSGEVVPIVAEGGPTDRESWGAVYAK